MVYMQYLKILIQIEWFLMNIQVKECLFYLYDRLSISMTFEIVDITSATYYISFLQKLSVILSYLDMKERVCPWKKDSFLSKDFFHTNLLGNLKSQIFTVSCYSLNHFGRAEHKYDTIFPVWSTSYFSSFVWFLSLAKKYERKILFHSLLWKIHWFHPWGLKILQNPQGALGFTEF